MIPYLIWGGMAVVCFGVAVKGFSKEGMPVWGEKRIKGPPAVVLAVVSSILGLACSGVLVLFILESSGADPFGASDRIREGRDKARTLLILLDITVQIQDAQSETGADPPRDKRALRQWLADHPFRFGLFHKEADEFHARFQDAWGNELHVVVGAKDMRIASSGPNGVWDNGEGDDMLGQPIEFLGDRAEGANP